MFQVEAITPLSTQTSTNCNVLHLDNKATIKNIDITKGQENAQKALLNK